MADPSEDGEARQFAVAFRRVLQWVHSTTGEDRNEVAVLVQDILGREGIAQSVVTRQLAAFEHVNLQTALEAWSTAPGRTVEVRGVAIPPHYGGVSLAQIVVGEGLPPLRFGAPSLVDLPNGPGTTLACLRLALLLVTDEQGRYVVLVQGPGEYQQELTVEVAGLPVAGAQELLARLDELRNRLNVYRGQLLDASIGSMGALTLTFSEPPTTGRADVVLPESVLGRIERHALTVAQHRGTLLAAHQHLKRGLLLYGPPRTGKTHTTRYLLGQMTDYTRLVLAGRALHAVGAVADLARDLHPAVVVLEDVDLVAEDRSFGPASSPILFDLLDAMDGGDPDADLLFLLTTNRADLLEPALAARPGRVDVAVEIPLPDAAARRQLFDLYAGAVELAVSDADVDAVVERTEGVTASFLKELVRRSVLESLVDPDVSTGVAGTHLIRALDDLLDAAQAVTRTLLGVDIDQADVPSDPMPTVPGPAWYAATGHRPSRHYGPR